MKMKKISTNFFLKNFSLIFVLILGVTLVTHILISHLLPDYFIAIAICIIFSFGVSLYSSKLITQPMKEIHAATSRMIDLEPDVEIPIDRDDEIGEVVKNVNHLYKQLRQTIHSLEAEIKKYSDLENQKIEFLQTVSHEMKAPLVTASALTNGMIHQIPPYDENNEEHLKELKFFLDTAIQLTKESLNLSEKYKKKEATYNLLNLVEEVTGLYGVILISKQLRYSQNIPDDVLIVTKGDILQKVLSNLFSNATTHSSRGGRIEISYEAPMLSISNTCVPLSDEKVEEIFKPLTTESMSEHSTGLGLFIVKQLLLQLGINYSFTTTEDHNGMVFKLDFSKKIAEPET